jgi:hypothetical protein
MLGRDTRTQTDDDHWGPGMSPRPQARRWRRAAVAVGILLPAAALPANPAAAASSCTTSALMHNFDGARARDATNVNGAYAYISYEPVAICGDIAAADSTTGSLDWVMVNNPNGNNQYAQAGYYRDQHLTAPALFAEYNDGGCSDTSCNTTSAHWTRKLFTTTFTVHGLNKFATGLSYGGNAMNMLVNDQIILTTPWDPHTAWTVPTGWEAQFFGETWDVGDDMPGTVAYPAKFRTVTTWGSTSGVGPAALVPSDSYPAFYKQTFYTNNGGFDIWTDRSGGTGGPLPVTGH